MSGWKHYYFKDFVEFPPKVSLVKGESYSFIPMEHISGNHKYAIPILEKVWSGSSGTKFEERDTLFARITPCLQNGKIAQAKNLKGGKGFGSTEYFIFRGINNISDTDFVFYLAQTEEFRKYAIGSMVGASGRQRADATFVGNYEFNLPPLPIQRRIASILSAYDDLIENNLKRIKLLEELAQRTYEEWFVKFRINGEQLPVDEKTGLPVGWERKSMTEVADFMNGFAFKPDDWMEMGLPIIKIKEMKAGVGGDTPRNDGKRVPAKFKISSGDILFSWSGSLEVIVWQGESGWLNQHLFLVKPKNNIPRDFVYHALLRALSEFNNLTTGATMKHIKRKELDFVKVALPKPNTLVEFKRVIEPVQSQILNLATQNQKLKESRDIILPKLMSGKINVT